MSEAADAPAEDFDAEFAAAKEADRGDPAPEVNDEGDAPLPEGEDVDPVEAEAKVDAETEKREKRLADAQKAMKAERRKRQELEQRLERLEKAGQAKEAPLTPEALLAKLRDDDEDPIGDIATVKQLAKLLVGQTQEETQQDAQARQRAQALQTVATTMKDYEDDFRELNPDYDKAAMHFMAKRSEELEDTGLSGDALKVAMQNEFAGLVSRSIQAGKDPADIIYRMAEKRGFSAKPDEAAADKLKIIERGQQQSKTLSGGGTSNGALSVGAVSNLRGAAFDAAFDRLRASERRR